MADHFCGPGVTGEWVVDLMDFYALMSSERVGQVVLIANVFPLAPEGAMFSDAVDYVFRLRPAHDFSRSAKRDEAVRRLTI